MEELVRQNKIFRFASELQHTKNEKSKTIISAILENLQEIKVNKKTKMELHDDHLATISKLAFKKKWFRLEDFQKEDRLKEFIDRTYPENKTKYYDVLLDYYKKGEIVNKDIVYNENDGIITSINKLKVNDNGDLGIELKKKK